jgi:TRAP-type C4-dicarboxylate transport system permease small subunit
MSARPRWTATLCARLAQGAIAVACVSLAGMTLIEAWQVFARYVLNSSPVWAEPVVLLLMSVAMMLGAAAGVRTESHFGFFLALHLSPPRVRAALRATSRLVIALIGGTLAVWGAVLCIDGWSIPMAGAPLPQGLYFLPIGIGGALMVIFAVERLTGGGPAEERDR